MKRYGQIIKIKPEMVEKYKELHAEVWSGVLEMISKCNIENYSIYLINDLLFAYFEYTGSNFHEDMEKMAADETTQRWWKECNPCQEPIETACNGDWWVNMEEVFHQE